MAIARVLNVILHIAMLSILPRNFAVRLILATLLPGAFCVLATKTVVAQDGHADGHPSDYPVFVLNTGPEELLVVEHSRNQVLRVKPGTPVVVAGNGSSDFTGDGGPATQAGLFLMSIARDRAGNLYIADHNHHRIRKVDLTGRITTIAGTGEAGFSGDNGPALKARLDDPAGVAVDIRGNVLIADSANNRIRIIDTQGQIQTLAGTGTAGFSGDKGPAVRAQLDFPWGLSVSPTGDILIADSGNNRIRLIDAQGVISTVAGNGSKGFGGDGGPARAAQLQGPLFAARDVRGNLYIADSGNNRVRRVDARGVITTVVGTGAAGFSGDGGPATRASLDNPFGLSLTASGSLYIADTGNGRVRRVSPDGRIETIPLSNP
ncbi:MAG: hypothetical protein H7Y22_15910 [Gemmatimonadaceae bacterium]|nr:hypothetical protein [Gloeobacterales cyanobacterium ES-bin-141]